MIPVLYYSPGACSLAPHICLEEIGAPYETVRVSLADGEQTKPEYLAINPRGQAPALAVNGRVLTENLAILAYLAERHPGANLLPEDAWERAQALSWMGFLSSSAHIAFAQIWRPARFVGETADHEDVKATGRRNALAAFAQIEAYLVGKNWAADDRFGVLDAYFLVFYRWGWRIGIDMAAYPAWTAQARRVAERPAVQRVVAREGIELGLKEPA